MNDDILLVFEYLDGIIAAENEVLGSFPFDGLEPLVASKSQLTAKLEALLVKRERENPAWLGELEPQALKKLRGLIQSVANRSVINEGLLERQIEYSTEMIAVIAAESQKLANNRSTKYTSVGRINQFDITTPVSIDTRT